MSSQDYRGYISSRMIERSVPQHIQQQIIREYCSKKGFGFLLSATEYIMGGTMILDSILDDIKNIQGIVMYSIFQLPESKAKRGEIYSKIISQGKELYFAAENIRIHNWDYTYKLEDIFLLRGICARG